MSGRLSNSVAVHMFGRKKAKNEIDDDDDMEEHVSRSVSAIKRLGPDENSRAKRNGGGNHHGNGNGQAHAGARAEEKLVRLEHANPGPGPSHVMSTIESDLAKLGERLREASEAFERERASNAQKLASVVTELDHLNRSGDKRAKELEEEVANLRAQMDDRDRAVRQAQEEATSLRRRLEGFEGLKQAMQNL